MSYLIYYCYEDSLVFNILNQKYYRSFKMKNTTDIQKVLKDYKSDKITLDEATNNLQMLITAYSGSRAHPPIVIDGKIVGKYCTKHKQYEPAEMFPRNSRSKDGLYSHCRYAEKRAKQYMARIQKLKDEFFQTENTKKQASIKSKIAELNLNKNSYAFEADAPSDAIKQLEAFTKKYKKELITQD